MDDFCGSKFWLVLLVNEVGLNANTFAVYPLDICNPILELVTYGLALATVIVSRNFGIPSCSVQFVFWSVKMVCNAVPFRTALRTYFSVKDDSDEVLLLVEIISYPLIVAQFLLNCWADSGTDFQNPLIDKSKPQTLRALPDMLAFVSPLVLDLLIDFVNGNEEPWKGYFYASVLIITDFTIILTRNHHFNMVFLGAFRVKSALMSAVYRKALVLSNATRRERTVGEIVNLMSVDIAKVFEAVQFCTLVWSAPLQLGVSIYFLWLVIGPSALAGLAVLLFLIPINGVVSTKLRAYQVAQMKKKDERVKLMSEILSGIKILKLYAWEPSYQAEVLKIREMEMKTLKAAAYASVFNDFMWTCS
ncbi:unnamed protein product, partial [Allacma fusca]